MLGLGPFKDFMVLCAKNSKLRVWQLEITENYI